MSTLARTLAMITTSTLILWIGGYAAFNVHIRGLTPAPADRTTEAIVVLTGGPSRINRGLDLLAAGKTEQLFISGVNTTVSVEALIALWRPDVDKPPCCITLGHDAQNTHENAAEARDWITTNEITSARLLTADYHMPRAWMEFRAQLPGMALYPHPVRASDMQDRLWSYPLMTLGEYNKTLFTWLRLRIMGEGH